MGLNFATIEEPVGHWVLLFILLIRIVRGRKDVLRIQTN